jgi:hypothetical protein
MNMTIPELYEQCVKSLPMSERLALAKIILNSIPVESVIDYNASWSDEDLDDFTNMTWKRADGESSNAAR